MTFLAALLHDAPTGVVLVVALVITHVRINRKRNS